MEHRSLKKNMGLIYPPQLLSLYLHIQEEKIIKCYIRRYRNRGFVFLFTLTAFQNVDVWQGEGS